MTCFRAQPRKTPLTTDGIEPDPVLKSMLRNTTLADTSSMNAEIDELQASLRHFATERDWEQFHSPKNLATALSVEASELLEHFQWLTDQQSLALPKDKRAKVAEEIADVLLYVLQLSDKLEIDPLDAARKKLRINGEKYPVERAKGTSKKYSEL